MVTDGEDASGLLADELAVLLVGIDPVVHHLTDVDETVDGPDPNEGPESEDLDDDSLDDLVVEGLEHELLELDGLVDGPVAVDDLAGADGLGLVHEHGDGAVLLQPAFEALARDGADDIVDVLSETGRRDADDLLDFGHHVHRMPLDYLGLFAPHI